MRAAEFIPTLPSLLLYERIEDIRSVLAPFKDDPDVFVSFTSKPKIGINPRSGYTTPIGVYAYPLMELWQAIVDDRVPFAGGRPYVQVIRDTSSSPLVTSEFDEADAARVEERLLTICQQQGFSRFDFNSIREDARVTAKFQSPIGLTWNLIRFVSEEFTAGRPKSTETADPRGVAFGVLLRKLGYDAVIDRAGLGIIHINEPTQAVFLTPGSYRRVAMFHNVRKEPGNTKVHAFEIPDFFAPNGWLGQSSEDKRLGFLMGKEWVDLLAHGHSETFTLHDAYRANTEIVLQAAETIGYRILTRGYRNYPKVVNDYMRLCELMNISETGKNLLADNLIAWSPRNIGQMLNQARAELYLGTILRPDVIGFVTSSRDNWRRLLNECLQTLHALHGDAGRALDDFRARRAPFDAAMGPAVVDQLIAAHGHRPA